MQTILIALLLGVCSSRIFETSFKMSWFGKNGGWIFIDKMVFTPGIVSLEASMMTSGFSYGPNSQVQIEAIPETNWSQSQNCSSITINPSVTHDLMLDGTISNSNLHFKIHSETMYYFILRDCHRHLSAEYDNNNLILDIKLHLLNNGKELGEEEDHWYIIPCIILGGISCVYYYIKQIQYIEQTDIVKILIFCSLLTQTSSLCWRSFGFILYRIWGIQYLLFQLVYLFMHSTSSAATLILVLLVAFGFTLTYDKLDQLYVYIPGIAFLGMFHIVCIMLTKLGHHSDRHHIFDSQGGTILYYFHIFIALLCLYGLVRTYNQARYQLKVFVGYFGCFTILYALNTPIIISIANYFLDSKDRNEFVFITTETVKFLTSLMLGYMVSSKTSYYQRVSYENNLSFIPTEMERNF